ncbi:unnamed protein product [Amoebophrya sp. A25]|nr:unnamed protein product [Amoebophrya sp. A25]|eukprot:GSA25T00025418001.1
MGGSISKPSPEFIRDLRYRNEPTLDTPLTLNLNKESANTIQLATHFYTKIWQIQHISWDRGGPFFHELFDFYKRYPKLQVEFLTQMVMQIRGNPNGGYAFKLHWVLMEFLFHGRNHVLINEILCEFYEAVIKECDAAIASYSTSSGATSSTSSSSSSGGAGTSASSSTTAGTAGAGSSDESGGSSSSSASTSSSSGPGAVSSHDEPSSSSGTSSTSAGVVTGTSREQAGGSSSSSSTACAYQDAHQPYRIKATAEYTLVNLKDIIDYGGGHGCTSGAPKWLVVEYHDSTGKVSYHRKIIRFKLYERKAKYVETVATEFGFPDPKNSELFVVYTDGRKTSYRVEEGDDMLQPREERDFDLDWTDCYFIYKGKDVPLLNNFGVPVKIPEENGQVFFLWILPENKELVENSEAKKKSSPNGPSSRKSGIGQRTSQAAAEIQAGGSSSSSGSSSSPGNTGSGLEASGTIAGPSSASPQQEPASKGGSLLEQGNTPERGDDSDSVFAPPSRVQSDTSVFAGGDTDTSKASSPTETISTAVPSPVEGVILPDVTQLPHGGGTASLSEYEDLPTDDEAVVLYQGNRLPNKR